MKIYVFLLISRAENDLYLYHVKRVKIINIIKKSATDSATIHRICKLMLIKYINHTNKSTFFHLIHIYTTERRSLSHVWAVRLKTYGKQMLKIYIQIRWGTLINAIICVIQIRPKLWIVSTTWCVWVTECVWLVECYDKLIYGTMLLCYYGGWMS